MVPRLPGAFGALRSLSLELTELCSQGTIEKDAKEGYKCTGTIQRIDDSTVEITELPIRTWTQNYKEMLESWVAGSDKQAAWCKVRAPRSHAAGSN